MVADRRLPVCRGRVDGGAKRRRRIVHVGEKREAGWVESAGRCSFLCVASSFVRSTHAGSVVRSFVPEVVDDARQRGRAVFYFWGVHSFVRLFLERKSEGEEERKRKSVYCVYVCCPKGPKGPPGARRALARSSSSQGRAPLLLEGEEDASVVLEL